MNYAMFCGGCGHGVLLRLICECLEEMNLDKKVIAAIGVGCSCHLKSGINIDLVQSPHGRAAAVATGMRRAEPDKFIFTYQATATPITSAWPRRSTPPTATRISAYSPSTTAISA